MMDGRERKGGLLCGAIWRYMKLSRWWAGRESELPENH